jgi:hypothetical protein
MASFDNDFEDLEKGLYTMFTAAQMAARSPLREVVKGIFPCKGVVALYGPPEAGKSFLALDLACSIADGSPWFGRRTIKSPVVYVVLEGADGFSKRIRAWQQHNARPMPGNILFVTGEKPNGKNGFSIVSDADIKVLELSARRSNVKDGVVIVDTLNRASAGIDENSSDGMGNIIQGLKLLQEGTDSLVVTVHHPGKDSTKGMRGHSSLLGALDATLILTDDRTWSSGKTKDFSGGHNEGFELKVVDIGLDEDGDRITSCVIVPTGIREKGKRPRPIGKWQQLVFSTLCMVITTKGDQYVEPLSNGHPSMLTEVVVAMVVDADPTNHPRAREMVYRAVSAMVSAGVLGGSYTRIWFT